MAIKTAKEIAEKICNSNDLNRDIDILKSWAEEIIEEAKNYEWQEMSWEQQQEQVREIKWKL